MVLRGAGVTDPTRGPRRTQAPFVKGRRSRLFREEGRRRCDQRPSHTEKGNEGSKKKFSTISFFAGHFFDLTGIVRGSLAEPP